MRPRIGTAVIALSAVFAAPSMVVSPEPASATGPGVHPDFNGDGYADLPIPVAGEDLGGVPNAGAIHVLYGSANGPRRKGSQLFSQETPGAVGGARPWEVFGLKWTSGDFDGDGFDDLAVGIMGDRIGGKTAGSVQVFFGSSKGLTTKGDVLLNEALPGFPGSPQQGDAFGTALAAGDFDGDGRDDLAVGNPLEGWGGGDDYGTIYVFHGRKSGISRSGVDRFNQSTPGVAGAPDDGDDFGASLAAGDFDRDGRDDLAIGAPGERVGAHNAAGVVHVLYGSPSGLRGAGDDLWSQAGPDVPGAVGTGDKFGSSLVVGRFDGDGRDDLAIGVAGDDVGAATEAGSVVVLRGRRDGLTHRRARLLSYATAGVKGGPRSDDLFGLALTAGDFDGDGHGDLAVAVPTRAVSGVPGAGEVVVFRGGASARPLSGIPRRLNQESGGVSSVAEKSDYFGTAVTAGDFDGDGRADLCVGAGGEDFAGIANAGVAHVMFGRPSGVNGHGSTLLSQNSRHIPNRAESADVFGNELLL